MRGFSPRNLKYMRAFAAAWPDREIVQEVLAQITCTQEIAFLEKVDEESMRLWQWSSPKKRSPREIPEPVADRQGNAGPARVAALWDCRYGLAWERAYIKLSPGSRARLLSWDAPFKDRAHNEKMR